MFTNCDLNGLLVEHAPHSVYAGEAWVGSTLPDISGNERHAVLTVVPLYWQTEQASGGWVPDAWISPTVPHGCKKMRRTLTCAGPLQPCGPHQPLPVIAEARES